MKLEIFKYERGWFYSSKHLVICEMEDISLNNISEQSLDVGDTNGVEEGKIQIENWIKLTKDFIVGINNRVFFPRHK